MLDDIITGVQPGPRRILLYGTAGIGKSTFGAAAPNPIFIQTEDGLGDIDCARFPLAASYEDALEQLKALYVEDHDYQTLCLDSVDWLERLIWTRVCADVEKTSIEEIGYAKGYIFALRYWKEFFDGLAALRQKKGIGILLIAHAEIRKFDPPGESSYDRFGPRLHTKALSLVFEWCDEVLFLNYKTYAKKQDDGGKRTTAVGTGERVLYTQERPSHLAKNRLGLPEQMPLDWLELNKYIDGNIAAGATTTEEEKEF